MEQTYKNILILACAVLFVLVFWVYSEISRSYALIELAKDPQVSIKRGTDDARFAFNKGIAHFQEIYIENKGWVYPGVLEEELDSKYKEYVVNTLWCGFRLHLEQIALDLGEYQHNLHYVSAYNLELIKLLNKQKR